MQSDDDNDENDQSSYYESSGDDDEMIHTTASKKEVRNTILFKFISSFDVNNVVLSYLDTSPPIKKPVVYHIDASNLNVCQIWSV